MTDPVKECLDILDKAIKFEETGMAFFEERAGAAGSALERSLFSSLAKDELGHKQYLLELREELVAQDDVDALPVVSGEPRTGRQIFESAMASASDPYDYKSEQLEIIEGALEVERKGYNMYMRAVDTVQSERAKGIFRHLAGEEQKHYQLLKNTHDYMADPEAWHGFDESPMLDGG